MKCDFCERDIDQRPIDQGGQPWLSRLEVVGTIATDGTRPQTGTGSVQKNYHTTCLRQVVEKERPG